MNLFSLINRDFYYTRTHEWIQFIDNEAYIGISYLKLADAHKVNKITYTKIYGFKRQGDVLAIIQLDSRQVYVHMPVDGRIVSIRNSDLLSDKDLLLDDAEHKIWLAKICPSEPLQKNCLLTPDQYK